MASSSIQEELNNLLLADPIPLHRIREISLSSGLQNTSFRRRVWPKLLGVDRFSVVEKWCVNSSDEQKYGCDDIMNFRNRLTVENRQQVSLDVARSLHEHERQANDRHLCLNKTQRRRSARIWEGRRQSLQIVIESVLGNRAENGADVLHYYQGMHDVVAVIMLVIGTSDDKGALACACADILLTEFLRDAAAATFDSVVACLGSIFPLVSSTDKDVGSAIEASGIDATVCLSWLITWFSHDLKNHLMVERLFDLMLASHPAMPLYLCASLILRQREAVLQAAAEAPGDFATMHCAIAHMTKSDMFTSTLKGDVCEIESWINEARSLMLSVPPHQLPDLKGIHAEAKQVLVQGACTL
jgi:hypothetical protein